MMLVDTSFSDHTFDVPCLDCIEAISLAGRTSQDGDPFSQAPFSLLEFESSSTEIAPWAEHHVNASVPRPAFPEFTPDDLNQNHIKYESQDNDSFDSTSRRTWNYGSDPSPLTLECNNPGTHALLSKTTLLHGICKKSSSSKKKDPKLDKIRHKDYSRMWRLRKKAELDSLLKSSSSLSIFRTLIEESPSMISIHSVDLDAKFVYISRAWYRAVGVEPGMYLGISIFEVVFEEDRQLLMEAWLPLLKGKHTIAKNEEGKMAQQEEIEGTSVKQCSYRIHAGGKIVHVESSLRHGQQGLVVCSKPVRDQIG